MALEVSLPRQLQILLTLASSSAAAQIIGIISTKLWAILAGPDGYGIAGALISISQISGLIGGLSLGTLIIRNGTKLISDGQIDSFQTLVSSCWKTIGWSIVSLFLLIAIASPALAGIVGSEISSIDIIAIAMAASVGVCTQINVSIINAHHRIKTLAYYTVIGSAIGALSGLIILYALGIKGIPLAILGSACSTGAVAWWMRRHVWIPKSTTNNYHGLGSSVIKFCLPATVSSLFGSGVQSLIPILVIGGLGERAAGNYRAAMLLSVQYISFVLIALAQDFFPRISAIGNDTSSLRPIVRRQFRISVTLVFFLSLCIIPAGDRITSILFTSDFYELKLFLPYLIIGNIFKSGSWVLGYLLLSSLPGWTLIISEITAGTVWLLLSMFAIHNQNINALGMAFLAAYGIHYIFIWILVEHWHKNIISIFDFLTAPLMAVGLWFMAYFFRTI